MMHVSLLALATTLALGDVAAAQSLQRRILDGSDGTTEFTVASRAGVCGDGATYLRDGFGGSGRISQGDIHVGRDNDTDWPPCVEGPLRIIAFVNSGEVIRLRAYVGPRRPLRDTATRDLGDVSVADAADFLTRTIEQANGRASSDAVLPLVLVDSINPWPTLIRFGRDERLSRAVRGSVGFWLARGASAKLGLTDRDEDANDDVRSSAVFALSQQPKDIAVPRLIEIARTSTHAGARAQALFWLGQSIDPRAIDVFEEILRRR